MPSSKLWPLGLSNICPQITRPQKSRRQRTPVGYGQLIYFHPHANLSALRTAHSMKINLANLPLHASASSGLFTWWPHHYSNSLELHSQLHQMRNNQMRNNQLQLQLINHQNKPKQFFRLQFQIFICNEYPYMKARSIIHLTKHLFPHHNRLFLLFSPDMLQQFPHMLNWAFLSFQLQVLSNRWSRTLSELSVQQWRNILTSFTLMISTTSCPL